MPDIPAPLAVMRDLLGTVEAPGDADNPAIIAWRDEIARRWPEMAEYTRLYRHDATPWCGYTVAYVMARCGIRPPFGSTDTERFLWAEAWARWGTPVNPHHAQPGDVVVLHRHVTLLDAVEGDTLVCIGGNQGDVVKRSRYHRDDAIAIRRPPAAGGASPAAPAPASDIGPSTSADVAMTLAPVPYKGVVASIRYNNPGAQWPSRDAARFGSIGYGQLSDGQGNKIARFPNPVNGAACNFDLLRRVYVGMTFGAAGQKWTGRNGFGIPGYPDDTVLTAEMVDDPAVAIPIMKAIARREAGCAGTLTDEQWRQAHEMYRAGSADAWLAAQRAPELVKAPAPAPPPAEVPATPLPAAPPPAALLPSSPDLDRCVALIAAAARQAIQEAFMTDITDLETKVDRVVDVVGQIAKAIGPLAATVEKLQAAQAAPAPASATPASPAAPALDLSKALSAVPWARLLMGAGTAGGVAGAAGAVDWSTLLPVLIGIAGAFGISISGPLGAIIKAVLPIAQIVVENADKRATANAATDAPRGRPENLG